mmetsp:Transcript_64579/g.170966  ORF Transcript_64579/g.170966 Transcript_64579/m.170966 type:complete len:395 (-) Transcript_64579:84-1268(-)
MFRSSVLAAACVPVAAWWGNGHMLVAEIARQELSVDEVAVLDDIIAMWHHDYPQNGDIVSVAVWPDIIKCADISSYCPKTLPDDMTWFNSWHFNNKPYNPDNLTLTQEQLDWTAEPSASWWLSRVVGTLQGSKSRFAFTMVLHFLIHVIGDVHQPLHSTTGFFNNSQLGRLPDGDLGGNLLKITSQVPGVNELHAFWDAGAGLYLADWPLSPDQQLALEANATAIRAEYPLDSSVLTERYQRSHGALQECWTSLYPGARTTSPCQSVFEGIINDSYAVAVAKVYPGVQYGGSLTQAYVESSRDVVRQQVALGGYRLADVLRLVAASAKNLPPQVTTKNFEPATSVESKLSLISVGLVVFCVTLLWVVVRVSRQNDELRRCLQVTPSDGKQELIA